MPAELAIRGEHEAAVLFQELGARKALAGEGVLGVAIIIIESEDAAVPKPAGEESHHAFRRGIQIAIDVSERDRLGHVFVEAADVERIMIETRDHPIVFALQPAETADPLKALQR